MGDYEKIQKTVMEKNNFTPKTCWIAHILSDYNQTTRLAPNRIDPEERTNPCPPEKRAQIESVMRAMKKIP